MGKTISKSSRQRNLVHFTKSETDFANGYDSNGNRIFFDVIDLEGKQDFDEISPLFALLKNKSDAEDNENEAIPSELYIPIHIVILDKDQLKLLVSALRIELKKRRKTVVGNKNTLRSRLKTALTEKGLIKR